MTTTHFSTTDVNLEDVIWIPWCYTSPAIYALIFYVMLVILAVFNVSFSIYALYKMFHQTEKQKVHSVIKALYIVINIFFGFGGLSYSIHLGIGFDCGLYQFWTTFGLTGFNFYSFGLALLYLLYLVRLRMLFHGNLPNIVFIIGGIGFIAQCIMPAFATYYFEILDWMKAVMYMNIFTFLNMAFSIYLLYLFWIKVNDLGRNHKEIDSQRLLSPAIRYAVCAFSSVISSELVNVVNIWRAYVEDNDFWWSLHLTLIVLDESVNLIACFMQFNFGKQFYFKYLSKIHSSIESRVIGTMSLSMNISTEKKSKDPQSEFETTKTTDSVTTNTGTCTWTQPMDTTESAIQCETPPETERAPTALTTKKK
eukprot:235994_1